MENSESFKANLMWDNWPLNEDNIDNELTIDPIVVKLNSHQILKFYKCRLCSYRTKSLATTQSHLNRHRAGNSKLFQCSGELEDYTCSECSVSTSLKVCLKDHIQMSQSVLGGNKGFNISAVHFLHLNEKKYSKTYKCKACSYVSLSKVSDIMHIIKCKRPKYRCKPCARTYKSQFLLNLHTKKQHPPPRTSVRRKNKFACGQCTFKCSILSDLTKHIIKHNQETIGENKKEPLLEVVRIEPVTKFPTKRKGKVRSKPDDALFKCTKCSFTAKHKKRLESHISTHGLKLCSMTECNFQSSKMKEINDHILMKHVSTKTVIEYTCHLCQFLTTEGKDLMQHVKSEHVFPMRDKLKKLKKCELCGLEFENGRIKQHILKAHIL